MKISKYFCLVFFLFLLIGCGSKIKEDTHTHNILHHEGKAATCTESGYKPYDTCTGCDYTTYEEILALGHSEGNIVIENNILATCTTSGSYDEVIYCKVCGVELSRSHKNVSALNHDYGEWIVSYDSTFNNEGLEQRICSRCGEIETRPIEKNMLLLVLI